MPVRWDSVLVRAVAGELDRRLRGLRCRAYHLDDSARSVWMFFDTLCLEMQLNPGSGAIFVHEAVEPHESATTLGADTLGVSSPADERRFTLSFRRRRGRSRRVDLVVEWAANRRNALVVTEADGLVQDCLPYRGPGSNRPHRGSEYRIPPPPGREGATGDLTRERWLSLVDDRSIMLATLAWTSPLNVDSLCSDPDEGFRVWQSMAAGATDEPGLLETPRGLQPYPCSLPGLGFQPATDLLAALAQTTPSSSFPADPGALRRIDGRRRSLERELASVRRELASTPDPTATRAIGDLILARLGTLKRGMAEASLTNFDGDPTMVRLDPTLEPHENADRFYREAGRAQRAQEKLPKRIGTLQSDLDRLLELRGRVERGEASPEEVPRWVDSSRPNQQNTESDTLPYRLYRSSGGLEIRVGRGARFNDELTFRHSRPNDVWLHARDAAGAHVILRWTGADAPPARDLEEAAVLAAAHSKSRHSAMVPVDWTRRKYVRKPRGARPGAVLPDRVKTVFVAPDDAPDRSTASGFTDAT